MDGLVFFLIRKKLQAIPKWPNIARFTLYTIAALFGGLSNGFGLGALIDIVSTSPAVQTNQVLTIYTLLFGFLLFLIDLYPVPKLIGGELPNYYPVEAITKLRISITFSVLRHFVFFIVFTHVLMTFVSKAVDFADGTLTFVLLMGFYLTNRTFVNLISYEVKNGFLITISGIALVSLGMVLYWFNGFSDLIFLSCMLVFLALFVLYVLTEVKRKTKVRKNQNAYHESLFLRMFSKKELRILVFMGFGIKLFIMFFLGVALTKKGELPASLQAILYLGVSPIVLFTYMGLNFFGINRTHFFTHLLRSANPNDLFKLYGSFMIILGIVDLFLLSIFFISTGTFSFKILAFYLTSFVLLFLAGFYFSLKTPIVRDNFISFDFTKNASIISLPAIISSFAIVSITYSIQFLSYYHVVYILLIALSIYAFKVWKCDMAEIGQKMVIKMKKA